MVSGMRLVLVEWIDSYGCSASWEPLDGGNSPKALLCRSVGWLFRNGKECKVIVPHISSPDNQGIPQQGCGDMAIPTKSIVRMIYLREPCVKRNHSFAG